MARLRYAGGLFLNIRMSGKVWHPLFWISGGVRYPLFREALRPGWSDLYKYIQG